MKIVRFTEFRRKASSYFSEVEQGETLMIVRHGKLIAEVSPSVDMKWKSPPGRSQD